MQASTIMTNELGQSPISRSSVLPVVEQHAEDATVLWQTRSLLTCSPHVELRRLRRLDDRLLAHLDGIVLAGADGNRLSAMTLEHPASGSAFVATVLAIESSDSARLDDLFALIQSVSEVRPGFLSAFGWVSAPRLQSTVSALLQSQAPVRRLTGITACAMHGVDPGPALIEALHDSDEELRARVLRTAGVLGKLELLDAVAKGAADPVPDCRIWSAWSSVLMGKRESKLDALLAMATQSGPFQDRSLRLALRAANLKTGNDFLRAMRRTPEQTRTVIAGAGIVGDPHYVPWLIEQMENLKLCRLAGESFSMITGLDLAYLDLDRKPPDNAELLPNDDPTDASVDMDPDDGLPWADPAKISAWWAANSARFSNGTRYFMGAPPTRAHCIEVLKNGFQRQRIAAALYLCLLNPGTPLFNTAAPAWRQERWLARLR